MPDPITAAEIADAVQGFAELLPDTCTILRAVDTSDGGGGQSQTWPPVAEGVPCRVAPASRGGESQTADRLVDGTTHVVTFRARADLKVEDRLDTPVGLLQVLMVRSGGAWELTRRVDARLVAD